MKNRRLMPCFTYFSALCLALLSFAPGAFAQTSTSNAIPVVTILATQRIATGPTNPGVFTVFRKGDTNASLLVYYQISGTASNGVDYALISNFVSIPAGARTNSVVITPITNWPSSLVKTAELQLAQSPLMSPAIPINYLIGVSSNALVYLEPAVRTVQPPTVNIFSPSNGAVYYAPTNIALYAKAVDLGGTVTNVEFFAGTNDLGPGLPLVLDPPGVNGATGLIYFLNWLNPSPGSYPVTAVATDNVALFQPYFEAKIGHFANESSVIPRKQT